MNMVDERNDKWCVPWLLGVFIIFLTFLGMVSSGCGNNPPSSSTEISDMPIDANMNSKMEANQISVEVNQANTSTNAQDISESPSVPAMPSAVLTPSATSPDNNMDNTNTEADTQGTSGSETTTLQPTPENLATPPAK